MMTALGDPTRQAILDRLSDGPRAVGDLASELPVSRPAVSQHLDQFWERSLAAFREATETEVSSGDPGS
jgi:DNA-binding transcriptional ArsR family regulator